MQQPLSLGSQQQMIKCSDISWEHTLLNVVFQLRLSAFYGKSENKITLPAWLTK